MQYNSEVCEISETKQRNVHKTTDKKQNNRNNDLFQ